MMLEAISFHDLLAKLKVPPRPSDACNGSLTCLCSLLFPVEEPGKIVSDDDAKVTTEGTLEEQDDGEKDDDEGQEVIKVYILKADSGDDDLGESTLGMGVILKSKHWCPVHASVSVQSTQACLSLLLLT